MGHPGARFCTACGARLLAPSPGLDAGGDARLAALADEVAAMREEMESLLVLKAQLDGAMQRMKQKGGAPSRAMPPPKANPIRPAARTEDASPGEPANAPDAKPTSTAEGETSTGTSPESSDSQAAADSAPTEIAVIHVEDRPDLQDAVQGAISVFKVATYHPESSLADGFPSGQPLLVVNLLSNVDPLARIEDTRLFLDQPRAFAYATDGTRGFVLGLVELFPPPFDPRACAERILGTSTTAPRVLVVSEAVLGTPELRGHLVRQGCTTSIAFDEKQALGLIPSVRPNLVLIDLNLPRGEGLRLAGRIRGDEHNRGTRIGFMWQQKIDPVQFHQFATRAANDFRFNEEDLRRFLLQEFNPGGAAYLENR